MIKYIKQLVDNNLYIMNFLGIKNKISEFINNFKKWSKKMRVKEKINFLDQLATLLISWIPITNSFKIISYQTQNKKLKGIIETILDDINKWLSLKECFSKFPNIFKIFDLSIIEMWELTWKVWESIEIIKIKEEKTKEIKSKIIGAFVYPMIIVGLSTIMVTIFILYVIPKITDMYKDAKVNLPKLTKFVIDLSDFLQANIFYICLSIVWIIWCFYIFKTNKRTKIYFDRYVLDTPIFWNLMRKKIFAMFTSSLGTLLKNGVIINKSLEISSWVVANDYYKKEINKITVWISSWKDFSRMLGIEDIKTGTKNKIFPIELASIVKIWEQTWKLPELLLKISDKYNKEIDVVVKNLSTAIEPIVIVVVWAIIGTLIMAIMLPFFNMVNVI